jgi:hypothetical protein
MAVLSARGVAQRLVKIQKLSSLYLQEVEELRKDAIRTTVDNLYRRWRQYMKNGGELSFLEWLVELKHFEDTFLKRNGVPLKRKWAFGYFNFLTRKELTLADDTDNLWMFEALEDAINAKHNDTEWVVQVETVIRDGIYSYRLKDGVAFMFGKVERPVLDIQLNLEII